jgi:hypothetical protein
MRIKHKWVQRRTGITGLLGKHINRQCQTLSHETRREQGREFPKPIVLESWLRAFPTLSFSSYFKKFLSVQSS